MKEIYMIVVVLVLPSAHSDNTTSSLHVCVESGHGIICTKRILNSTQKTCLWFCWPTEIGLDNNKDNFVSECSLQVRMTIIASKWKLMLSASPDQCCVSTPFPPTTTNHNITTAQTHSSQATVQGQQTSVSLGITIGLVCVGFAVGGLVSCLLCACLPNLYKSTPFMSLRTKKQVDSGVTPSATQETKKAELEGQWPKNDQQVSHVCDGMNISLSNERQRVLRKKSKEINSLDNTNSITSPVYNEISDESIQSFAVKDHNDAYQTLKARRSENSYQYLEKPDNSVNNSSPDGQGELGEDGDESAKHTYYTLNPFNVCSDVNPK
ncbi:uncharacterized protein LOC127832287 isoform X2 [Dreissena polymorpha]|uniref:uncharacterized protein LOC127832287 isoform X2 n=1 Tax=Dreissena polymorpha TaxID=45954 RepID=UPI0022652164|nr:uncharacterized protein LOC127832287 isoform X2 [Dreissena polymorpha]